MATWLDNLLLGFLNVIPISTHSRGRAKVSDITTDKETPYEIDGESTKNGIWRTIRSLRSFCANILVGTWRDG